ncbi:MAG: hypothetical protein GXO79_09010 [Chlorobi bacterium]|nr:hypothetical protein [Chlorobiota bacterium]
MKRFVFTYLILLVFSELYSQNNNSIKESCIEDGIKITSDVVKVNPEEVLEKYLNMPVYKIYLKVDDNEVIEFGPAKSDLIKVFGEQKENKDFYCLKNIAGLNFAAIQALSNTISDLQNRLAIMEESQDLLNKQTADLSELQNQVLDLTSSIEELKQQNTDLQSALNDLKVEISTK